MREFGKRSLLDIKTRAPDGSWRSCTERTSRRERSTFIARSFTPSSSSPGARTVSACRATPSPARRSARKMERSRSRPLSPRKFLPSQRLQGAALTAAAAAYAHSSYSPETEREWARINEQDAAFFTIAACTGLRLGELLALRWRDINLKGGVLIVSRSISAGKETSTKSRRPRTVPSGRSGDC